MTKAIRILPIGRAESISEKLPEWKLPSSHSKAKLYINNWNRMWSLQFFYDVLRKMEYELIY